MQELEQTIRECQRGNALAWEALIRRYQAKVYGVAYYFLGNSADAQEATQDVFIKLYQNLGNYAGGEDSFMPWLMSIARHCCIDRIRKTRTQSNYESDYQQDHTDGSIEHSTPESILVQQQNRNLIYQALEGFEQVDREIILLKEIQGLKVENVAEILQMPIGTVKSRSNRARIKLAKLLGALSDAVPQQPEAI